MSSPGPLALGVAELLRRPGTRRDVVVSAALDGLVLDGLEVRAGPTVDAELVAESLPDAIVVSGTASTRWHATCRRCLEPIDGEVRAEVRAVYSDRLEDDDVEPLPEEVIDLAGVVREAVLLALPLAPLCSDDCTGPDPARFPTGPPDESEPRGDPRWAALDALRFDDDA